MVTRAWILLQCVLALLWTPDINFMFFSSNFSSSIFTLTRNGVPYLALINRFGELKIRCSWDIRHSLLWAICQDLKFGQVLLHENLCYVSITMHECVQIGVRLKNCSWDQVVTRAWILWRCILALHWTKDVNFMFFSTNVSSSIFASTNNGVSYLALINGFGQLKVRCSWDIRDSPLSAICQDLKFGQIITRKSFWSLINNAWMR